MDTVSDIFDALGGVTVIANGTGIPLTTVHSWKRTGFVPHWRVEALAALAEKQGKSLDIERVPVRSSSTPAAAA